MSGLHQHSVAVVAASFAAVTNVTAAHATATAAVELLAELVASTFARWIDASRAV